MLLFCTLFGLAAMHTLGHAGLHMDEHTHPAVSAVTAFTAACAGDGCGGHEMSGWSICLAVLGGLAALVLLGAVLVGRLAYGGPGRAGGDARGPRAPPGRRAGLTEASIAVLRI